MRARDGGKARGNACYRSAERLGVDIRYDCPVWHLQLDGTRFVAAITRSGERPAARACVLAAGGFESSSERLRDTWVGNERGEWPADHFLIRGTRFNAGTLPERRMRSDCRRRISCKRWTPATERAARQLRPNGTRRQPHRRPDASEDPRGAADIHAAVHFGGHASDNLFAAGEMMARVRGQTYTDYAWPAWFGTLYRRNGLVVAITLAAALALFLVLAVARRPAVARTSGR